jgi:hypothetical protein
MREAKSVERHWTDEMLWQWRDGELKAQETAAHLKHCALCRQRAEAVERLWGAMQKAHHAVQPTLAEQMQLAQALEEQFIAEDTSIVFVHASRRLVRWLAPVVAVLAALFVLFRQEAVSSADALTGLLSETPESQLLMADTDEQLQQAMWEMALSFDETQK